MDSWVARLADRFDPSVSRLSFVRDLDGLLGSPDVQAAIRQRGFDIARYDDPIEFRFTFESTIRPPLESGEGAAFVVQVGTRQRNEIPYDMLSIGGYVEIGFGSLVPKLNAVVLRDVPPADLGRVIAAAEAYDGDLLGEQGTRAFLLRDVYGVSIAALSRRDAVVEYLLRRHGVGDMLPESLDEMLAAALEPSLDLGAPILPLLRRPEAFYQWLQGEWGGYVEQRIQTVGIRETAVAFDVAPIRVYLDNLFTERLLEPVSVGDRDVPGWMLPGVVRPGDRPEREIAELLTRLTGDWPLESADYQAWLAFAWRWAALRARIGALADKDAQRGFVDSMRAIQAPMDLAFAAWMESKYRGLASLAGHTPIMVHQIAATLHRAVERGERVALLLLDGLALDHWLALRELVARDASWTLEQAACFSWVPTLTSISRQAIFAGRPPSAFPDSWTTTSQESHHWRRLGKDWGLPDDAIWYGHLALDTTPGNIDEVLAAAPRVESQRLRLLALVVNDIDSLSHASRLGFGGMHDDVRRWAATGRLRRALSGLLDRRFTVYLAADHGSVEAVGAGQPQEGTLVEQRALRARIYTDAAFAAPIPKSHPHARPWSPVGLPRGLHVLVAAEHTAFAPVHEVVIAHGGVSLEEVVVPFVRIGSAT